MSPDAIHRPVSHNRIDNDPELLAAMMTDLRNYYSVLGPGPYWLDNQRATIEWLNTNDLNAFRVYENDGKGLSNFGGGSRWPKFSAVAAELEALDRSLVYRLGQKLGIGGLTCGYRRRIRDRAREILTQRMLANLILEVATLRDTAGELRSIEMAPVGNPSDAIDVDGRLYTPKFIDEFLKYLDMKQEMDFSQVKSIVEIGPGVGTFAEVLAKLDPDRRIYLIDIPPQLYVLEKVMFAIFPGQVLGYAESMNNPARLYDPDWRVAILAPWQAEILELDQPDMAFNQVSFSEMRRETALGYLDLLDRWGVRNICLRAADQAKNPEGPGMDDYVERLGNYTMTARHPIMPVTKGVPASAKGGNASRPASALYFRRSVD